MDKKHVFTRDDSVRARILSASCRLFAQRGQYGVAMDDISRELHVEPAFLQDYFIAPDEIHAIILDTFIEDLSGILMSFFKSIWIPLRNDNKARLSAGMISFDTVRAAESFVDHITDYLYALLDFFMENRNALRITLCSSIMAGAYHGCVRRMYTLFMLGDENPLLRGTEAEKDRWCLSKPASDACIRHVIAPILDYSAFYDDNAEFTADQEESERNALILDIKERIMLHIRESNLLIDLPG